MRRIQTILQIQNITNKEKKSMDFLGLLKDIISVVVVANAVTGHKDENASEEYFETLTKILESDPK